MSEATVVDRPVPFDPPGGAGGSGRNGGDGGPSGPSIWARLGGFSFRNRRGVFAAWATLFLTTFILVGAIGTSPDSTSESPDSESARGFTILADNFGAAGSFISGSIVFEADAGITDPAVAQVMTALFDEVAAIPEVTLESPYAADAMQRGLVAPPTDGSEPTIAFARLGFSDDTDELRASEIGGEIHDLVENPSALVDGITPAEVDATGLNIEVGGSALSEFEPPESELIGIAFAIVILILAFGSVLAMGLPIGVALFGVGIGVGSIQLLSNVISIPSFATQLGAMIGLGVGIDYALFIVTRYREGTRAGLNPERATIVAIDTAGRAVVFAGFTVVISLLGMYVMNLSFINGMATGAALTVAVTMVASITLLPALLGFAQHRVEVTRWRGLIMAGGAAFAFLGVGIGFPIFGAVGLVIFVGTLLLSFVLPGLREALPPRREQPLRDTWSYRWCRFLQQRPMRDRGAPPDVADIDRTRLIGRRGRKPQHVGCERQVAARPAGDALHHPQVRADDRHVLDREGLVRQVVHRTLRLEVRRVGRDLLAVRQGRQGRGAVLAR